MRSKNNRYIDGLGGGRKSLTDYQPLNQRGGRQLGQSNSDQGNSGHESKHRFSSTKQEFDENISKIESSKDIDSPHRRFRSNRRISRTKRVLKLASLCLATIFVFFGVKALIALQSITERNFGFGALALQHHIDPSQIQKEGDGRINVLAIGIPGKNHPGGQLADTIMVVSIDPFNNEMSMLSIPRDFYLSVPGYYSTRINAVHAIGEDDKDLEGQGGGPKLLTDTVERILGVDIHYFVRADFDGFVQAVDTVGGIDVEVKELLYDSSTELIYRDFDGPRFYYEPGTHSLNGKRAIQFARCRKSSSCGSDFGRAERQQQILLALREKVLSLPTLTNPLKVSSLIDSAGNHVRTNINIRTELPRFVEITQNIDTSKTRNYVLSNAQDGMLLGRNIGGASVLVPGAGLDQFSEIQEFVRSDIFRDGFLKKEGAKITILNGTDNDGLATRTKKFLESYGYEVVRADDAPDSVDQSTIYSQAPSEIPFTLRLLEKRLSLPSKHGLPTGYDADSDVVIILGTNFSILDG